MPPSAPGTMTAAFIFSPFPCWSLLASSRHQDRNNPYPRGPSCAFRSTKSTPSPAACSAATRRRCARSQNGCRMRRCRRSPPNNLAETAFFVSPGEGYLLRWFTPTVEVDLCGHATLASGYVVTRILAPERRSVTFDTLKAGPLEGSGDGELLAMDLRAWPPEETPADPRVLAALGAPPVESFVARGRTLVVYDRAEDVAALRPDFAAMRRVEGANAIATAPGRDDVDFVSRYFA